MKREKNDGKNTLKKITNNFSLYIFDIMRRYFILLSTAIKKSVSKKSNTIGQLPSTNQPTQKIINT